jgi:cytochrome c553
MGCFVRALVFFCVPAVAGLLQFLPSALAGEVSFDRDVRPILAEHCFACHGPDAAAREADLRLDTRDGALADLAGTRAVVPGNTGASELVTRIRSTDPDVIMPPPALNKPLSDDQKATLERWIAAGAEFEGHWAYRPLARPPLPAGSAAGTNPVDVFVDAALAARGIAPAAEADRVTLIRRLCFDLTGLPPTPAEIDAFVADTRVDAYELLVDRLLASPHHSERLTAWWLDLVRYADSVGYHGDQEITMWPYREWVIKAFASNMPFDRFTREQLAGDLLADRSREQRIAAAFNRLNMMSAEGGGQDKEYHARYAADRVRATAGAWLGSTVGCAECHDHKFDPFTTRDFYALSAFFADVAERGIYHGANHNGTWGEMMRVPTPEQEAQQRDLEARLAAMPPAAEMSDPKDSAGDVQKAEGTEDESKSDNDAGDEDVAASDAHAPAKVAAPPDPAAAARAKLKAELDAVIKAQTSMPATVSTTPRVVRILPRGNWMDDSGEVLAPATPAFLPPAPGGEKDRRTRLDLAAWMTSPENPLVPRVLANRLWAIAFGEGLSRRLDDHGSQGEAPSHPELLDWLAAELRDEGWEIRRVLRTLVTSRAYRRVSTPAPGHLRTDPENRLLARQNRHRVDAENMRDVALAASGLLERAIGGPSVKPAQPEGYWDYLNFPTRTYKPDTGAARYRRGLYVHWQRQYLHPALMVFDAPSREECTARRPRSNTPLQALVLLNDPQFVEAARALAIKTLAETQPDPLARAGFMLRQAIGRVPTDAEVGVVADIAERQREFFGGDPAAATKLLSVGGAVNPQGIEPVDLAAWMTAARVVLNLGEAYTRN